ncbi:MspA family porin [Rhodococcus sp. NPDC058505]|uniref:MspA family porin n=1 Tax=unclassified Rhodococcus (in: high G+C Gram-positive bacteria) TaxID=192944 RepID=UPI003664F58E
MALAVTGLLLGSGTAAAEVDNVSSMMSGAGQNIEVLQGDTRFTSVPPLDGSPLSREFFHSGYAGVNITGPGADALEGSLLTVGYQIGYPIALAGATIGLNTPALGFVTGSDFNIGFADLLGEPIIGIDFGGGTDLVGDIIPSQSLDIDLEPGGITDVPILLDKPFDGASALVRMSGVHGSVAGAIGAVSIRPYARVQLASGDIVVTYGVPFQV